MKLNEVAAPKFGIILAAGNQSIDAGDWHGSSEVYTNKAAFTKAVKDHFLDHAKSMGEEGGDDLDEDMIAKIKTAKSVDQMADIAGDDWENFIDQIWIDDRF